MKYLTENDVYINAGFLKNCTQPLAYSFVIQPYKVQYILPTIIDPYYL